MLCDAPSNYQNEQECVDFITSLPVETDFTKILSGEMGKYIVTARRKDINWYIGGMTNWDQRDIALDLPFLKEGDNIPPLYLPTESMPIKMQKIIRKRLSWLPQIVG